MAIPRRTRTYRRSTRRSAAGEPAGAPPEHPDQRRRASLAPPPPALPRDEPPSSSASLVWALAPPPKGPSTPVAGRATSCAKSPPSPARPRAPTAPHHRRPGRTLRDLPTFSGRAASSLTSSLNSHCHGWQAWCPALPSGAIACRVDFLAHVVLIFFQIFDPLVLFVGPTVLYCTCLADDSSLMESTPTTSSVGAEVEKVMFWARSLQLRAGGVRRIHIWLRLYLYHIRNSCCQLSEMKSLKSVMLLLGCLSLLLCGYLCSTICSFRWCFLHSNYSWFASIHYYFYVRSFDTFFYFPSHTITLCAVPG
jgi:hypothetical protein